ncbi:hypothetical protein [Paenibacillus glacialis]|uniref:Uncharacterized protein n=1 Tax=Paenibacillus glacialis TaxID=494026 RepID=A0A168I6P6_9BACL|nr:hypothetical protein [Paenibacillus glacialis]OAB38924.1 hypothetical protein PGLA_19330 [Paenibacillus glacialis]
MDNLTDIEVEHLVQEFDKNQQVYQKPISYDQTMREMQENFKKIFANQAFAAIIAKEIGDAMTDLINKMIIVI